MQNNQSELTIKEAQKALNLLRRDGGELTEAGVEKIKELELFLKKQND